MNTTNPRRAYRDKTVYVAKVDGTAEFETTALLEVDFAAALGQSHAHAEDADRIVNLFDGAVAGQNIRKAVRG